MVLAQQKSLHVHVDAVGEKISRWAAASPLSPKCLRPGPLDEMLLACALVLDLLAFG